MINAGNFQSYVNRSVHVPMVMRNQVLPEERNLPRIITRTPASRPVGEINTNYIEKISRTAKHTILLVAEWENY